jgi:hypothetical protein
VIPSFPDIALAWNGVVYTPFRFKGIPMRRVLACLLPALLAACAGAPTDPKADNCLLNPHPSGTGVFINEYDALFLPVYFIYGFSCEGIRALDRHGAFDAAPKGTLEDGVYTAVDHTFSVRVPAGLGIHEESYANLDYVLFAPRITKGAVYAVKVVPELEPIYGSLTLDQFASVELKDARFQSRLAAGIPLQELRREATTLAGQPALTIVYSQTPEGADKPTAYYLLYFVKTRHRSAVLSVAWPGDCPKCSMGPDADVRTLDPALEAFLSSFVLGGTSSDYQ